jgi:hypothetical protein
VDGIGIAAGEQAEHAGEQVSLVCVGDLTGYGDPRARLTRLPLRCRPTPLVRGGQAGCGRGVPARGYCPAGAPWRGSTGTAKAWQPTGDRLADHGSAGSRPTPARSDRGLPAAGYQRQSCRWTWPLTSPPVARNRGYELASWQRG